MCYEIFLCTGVELYYYFSPGIDVVVHGSINITFRCFCMVTGLLTCMTYDANGFYTSVLAGSTRSAFQIRDFK